MDKLVINGQTLPILVALSDAEQARGLMWRAWPPPAMAFPYEAPLVRKFWMKDTECPLELLFCRQGKVLSVVAGQPFSLEFLGPDQPSDLVVELPKGSVKKFNIMEGSPVKLVYSLFTLARRYELKLAKLS